MGMIRRDTNTRAQLTQTFVVFVNLSQACLIQLCPPPTWKSPTRPFSSALLGEAAGSPVSEGWRAAVASPFWSSGPQRGLGSRRDTERPPGACTHLPPPSCASVSVSHFPSCASCPGMSWYQSIRNVLSSTVITSFVVQSPKALGWNKFSKCTALHHNLC